MVHRFDFLVIGSGIAGLSYSLKMANKGNVAILCKTTLEETNTFYAQGGIASVTLPWDDFEKHINDTLIAGDGLCNRNVVEKVVREAPQQIKELIRWGVNFDKDSKGSFSLHKEGGHSECRILHHKDNTGQEIQESLVNAVKHHPNIIVFDHHFAIEILTQHHLGMKVTRDTTNIECYGAYVLSERTNKIHTFLSKITMICTGGIGNIYQTTTNPLVATGDGIAIVYRAKGLVRDMEFVQFHPTALYNPMERPAFLISEALRGYGAILRTKEGKEFMHRYDSRGSLAPRDIVARAIDNEMKSSGSDFVYLDLTHINAKATRRSYPTIYKKCLSEGIDITHTYIPVIPAAHYLCGGIVVDENAKTSIHRLYAAGECSCTGLHGANRLASNSLIEAIIYADAAAQHSVVRFNQYVFNEDIPQWNAKGTSLTEEMALITQSIKEVGAIMSNYVGIVRSNLRLERAMKRLEIIYRETENLFTQSVVSRNICELRNIICVGYLVVKQAMKRKESRGLHYNIDYQKKIV
ncbi:MAG: L-aspartate oxidase [Candidatus Azobacteroides pseudotrichonymphae]|jgi:L-aspartate oxidase|nr:L-aspartate oxidase [Bacteroidales bacterium OttesenSCG-928-I14]GMO32376.1 MAG: L-aspartate oxidase [Candidatus Azobacteroides pseudotrichonymphae]